jgi:phospholipid/cholesterol/gamma-HCH transport system substrate-binding protein
VTVARTAAVAAVVLVAGVAVHLLLGGSSPYTVELRLENASQLVKGNLVQVSGTSVGKVQEIELTPDGLAQVRITVDDDYAPLKRGTLAVVRQASLSGIANRYIDLQQGPMDAKDIPDGATLPATTTESAVDLDQLFNVFDPETRGAARVVIRGLADMTEGRTREANEAIKYLNPVMSASSRLFDELNRNPEELERFVVQSSRLVTDVSSRADDLAGIVSNFGQVSTALANEDRNLQDAIRRLPGFLRKSNSTFVNLRATLDDLDPLVRESRPVVRDLRPLLGDLRSFARSSRPTFRDLARTIEQPGSANDLVELLGAQAPLARVALDRSQVNGASRRGAFPELVDSLRQSTPKLAFFRPYAPDLVSWFDDFSTSGSFDALGSFSRAGLALGAATFAPALNLIPIPGEIRDEFLAAGATIGRNNRCPGSIERPIDGSNPLVPQGDEGDPTCDPTMLPIGP